MRSFILPAFEGKKTHNKQHNIEESTEESDTNSNTNIFARVTRSGGAFNKIIQAIQAIDAGNFIIEKDSMECIMGCGKNKSMLLLPCQHQHTCKECWLIWKIESLKKVSHEILDSSTYDDTLMLPKCPLCRKPVNKAMIALN